MTYTPNLDGVLTEPPMTAAHSVERRRYTLTELMATTFPEPRWAVPDLVPEGLTILAGAPKAGKSWLALHLCLAVAAGGYALGSIPVARGDAFYLALEDNEGRLQRRVAQLLAGEPAPDGVTVQHEAPAAGPELNAEVESWRVSAERPRLVVVDVMARVRPAGETRNAYQADYDFIGGMQAYAREHGLAVLVVHHTNKASWTDSQDGISGTRGIAGAADTTLVLRRERLTGEATLDVTGRDVEETQHALTFDGETGTWRLTGPGALAGASDVRRRVVDLLNAEAPLKPLQVADRLGLTHDNARQLLRRMGRSEQVAVLPGGRYAPLSHVSPGHYPSDEVTTVTDPYGVTGGPSHD